MYFIKQKGVLLQSPQSFGNPRLPKLLSCRHSSKITRLQIGLGKKRDEGRTSTRQMPTAAWNQPSPMPELHPVSSPAIRSAKSRVPQKSPHSFPSRSSSWWERTVNQTHDELPLGQAFCSWSTTPWLVPHIARPPLGHQAWLAMAPTLVYRNSSRVGYGLWSQPLGHR